ncbi:uncharacterized protein BX663DRAFT_583966 [Cokeromyces recurvatus]|uniref:uncharacterized protein n=1 Tax=Cokeromyces recurvatus TaxID=90255 RepID=UPI00222123F3|nr:uncharacterized protein BX663DRAFT_583966 [Cokeromyces recurvatus]KAI7905716.1 hypothetical protein BX663DRAFT_583966 [Cokeromyces recurvatus]
MFPSFVRFFNDYCIALVPLVIWSTAGIFMSFRIFKNKLYNNTIVYTSMVAVIGGIISAAITFITADDSILWKRQTVFYVFYSISISFTYISIFLAFLKLEGYCYEASCNDDPNLLETRLVRLSFVGKRVIYVGFLWSAITISAGFAVTLLNSLTGINAISKNGVIFIYLSGWGFIAVHLSLLAIYFKQLLRIVGRFLFLFYTLASLISTIAMTVLGFLPAKEYRLHGNVIGCAVIFTVDIPAVLAILFVFFIGHLWTKIDDLEVVAASITRDEPKEVFMFRYCLIKLLQ